MEYVFFLDGKRVSFKANGRKRVPMDDEYVLVNAKVKLADGTILPAVLEIDESSSGELGGAHFLLPGAIATQGSDCFLSVLNKTQEEVFPYRYKLMAKLKCEDIHVGENGWSR